MKDFIQKLEHVMEHDRAHSFFAFLIILNAVFLGLETIPEIKSQYGNTLIVLDKTINYIFVIEITLRMIGMGKRFFKSGWNIFDVLVIGGSLIAVNSSISALRAFRIMRLTEILSLSKNMRIIVNAFVKAIPGAMHMALIIGMIFYIFSLIAHDLFSQSNPDMFGTLDQAMMKLLLILLGDGIGDAISATTEVYEHAYLFFLAYVSVMSFTLLNLLFGIIIDAIQSATENEENSDNNNEIDNAKIMEEISKLQAKVDELMKSK